MIPALINKLKDNLKSTILISKDFEPEKAISLEVIKFKIGKIKGLALDVVASEKGNVGVGVSKDIYSSELFEIDTGIYVTRHVKNLFNRRKMPDIKLGISAKFGSNKKGYIKKILKGALKWK